MILNPRRKSELKVNEEQVSLHSFKLKETFDNDRRKFKPSEMKSNQENMVTEEEAEMHGIVNRAFANDCEEDGQRCMIAPAVICSMKTEREESNNELRIGKNVADNFVQSNDEVDRLEKARIDLYKDSLIGVRKSSNRGQPVGTKDENVMAGEHGGIACKAEKMKVCGGNAQNGSLNKNPGDGQQWIAASSGGTLQMAEGRQNGARREPTHKLPRNAPITPSIIITTEPFGKMEKIRRKIKESSNDNDDKWEDLRSIDNIDGGMRMREAEYMKKVSRGGDLSCFIKTQGIEENEKVRRQGRATEKSPTKKPDLLITEINDFNDYNDRKFAYHAANGRINDEFSGNAEESNCRTIAESGTPILDMKIDENSANQSFDQSGDRTDHGRKIARRSLELSGAMNGYGKATSRQISINDAVKLLRRKRHAFANRKSTPNAKWRGAGSTESSLKSTDADDQSSETSVGPEDLHGIFKNLNEQHKIIEKRSNALINFRPNNRCDTRLVSSAYDMASAMELQRNSIHADSITRQGNCAPDHSVTNANSLRLNSEMLETSKPSTSTSYFNDDGESLTSGDEARQNQWAPNWIYTTFTILVWNSVVAFMHGIEGNQMGSCNRSIKWRLWCTIVTCVLINFLLELLYERKGAMKAIFSSVIALGILVLATQHPIACHVAISEIKPLNYVRASGGILIAVFLFVLWLKTGTFQLPRKPSVYEGKKGRKLSQIPISDLENR